MVNGKTKKVEKKSVGRGGSSSKKAASATKKKNSTDQKKKGSVKKVTATKTKTKKTVIKSDKTKPSAKKTTKKKEATTRKTTTKVVEKRKPVKKTVKKHTGSESSKGKADLRIKKASNRELKKVDNVIGNLSKASGRTKKTPVAKVSADKKATQGFVTTVPGVYRRVPVAGKTTPSSHNATPIRGIMNYLKNIF